MAHFTSSGATFAPTSVLRRFASLTSRREAQAPCDTHGESRTQQRFPGLTQCCTLLFLLTAWSVASTGQAQAQPAQWTQSSPVTNPVERSNATMTNDSGRGRVVLFGGYSDSLGVLGSTWEWDGSDWTQRLPFDSPSSRYNSVMQYDSKRGNTVLFGGYDETFGSLEDTWKWDGSDWTQLSPANSPLARYSGTMTYDSKRGRIILFGGYNEFFGVLNDTWEWDGSTWIKRTPKTAPPARFNAVMAYDSARGRSVLFSGYNTDYMNDTWEWDGTNWKEITPSTSPSVRYSATMVYDPVRARSILFGGETKGSLLNDTWEWDGANWAELTPSTSPAARAHAVMAYDSARKRSVVFGGYAGPRINDTWELELQATPPHLTLVGGKVKEGDTGSTVTLNSTARLDHAVDYPITLEVYPSDNTATPGEDYTLSPWPLSVTIPAGKTSAPMSVTVIGDDEVEGDESVVLLVTSVTGDVIEDQSYVVSTIVDDDATSPVNVSITPTTTTSQSGQAKSFTSTQSDPDGATDIEQAMLLISSNGQAKGGILARYDNTTKLLYLRDEGDKTWIGGFAPGSDSIIATRYGSLDCKGTKVTLKGERLIIKWSITPRLLVSSGQTRTLKLSLSASDTLDTIVTSDLASWTITATSLQNIRASMTSPSSPIGKSNTLNIEIRNSGGVGQERITFLINATATNAKAIAGVIDVAANTIALYDDGGRKLGTPVVFGTRGAVLSNSQGTVNVGASKLKVGTQSVITSLSVVPSSAFGTGSKGLYLKTEASGQATPRDLMGKWNITAKGTKAFDAPGLGDTAPSAGSS